MLLKYRKILIVSRWTYICLKGFMTENREWRYVFNLSEQHVYANDNKDTGIALVSSKSGMLWSLAK